MCSSPYIVHVCMHTAVQLNPHLGNLYQCHRMGGVNVYGLPGGGRGAWGHPYYKCTTLLIGGDFLIPLMDEGDNSFLCGQCNFFRAVLRTQKQYSYAQ